jgi:hypothetical protein
MPYGVTADYIKFVEAADSEQLAKLIKTVALLLQTKVYLFWSRQIISQGQLVTAQIF